MSRIIIIVVIALVTLGLIIFLAGKLTPKNPISFQPSPPKFPAQLIKDGTDQVLSDTKSVVLKQTVTIVDNIDSSLKAAAVSNPGTSSVVLGTQTQAQSQNGQPPDVTVVDFLTRRNLILNLSKDTQYFLQFKNFPPAFCLYVDTLKYPVQNDKLLSLQFTQAGTFPLRVDFCDSGARDLGQVTVK